MGCGASAPARRHPRVARGGGAPPPQTGGHQHRRTKAAPRRKAARGSSSSNPPARAPHALDATQSDSESCSTASSLQDLRHAVDHGHEHDDAAVVVTFPAVAGSWSPESAPKPTAGLPSRPEPPPLAEAYDCDGCGGRCIRTVPVLRAESPPPQAAPPPGVPGVRADQDCVLDVEHYGVAQRLRQRLEAALDLGPRRPPVLIPLVGDWVVGTRAGATDVQCLRGIVQTACEGVRGHGTAVCALQPLLDAEHQGSSATAAALAASIQRAAATATAAAAAAAPRVVWIDDVVTSGAALRALLAAVGRLGREQPTRSRWGGCVFVATASRTARAEAVAMGGVDVTMPPSSCYAGMYMAFEEGAWSWVPVCPAGSCSDGGGAHEDEDEDEDEGREGEDEGAGADAGGRQCSTRDRDSPDDDCVRHSRGSRGSVSGSVSGNAAAVRYTPGGAAALGVAVAARARRGSRDRGRADTRHRHLPAAVPDQELASFMREVDDAFDDFHEYHARGTMVSAASAGGAAGGAAGGGRLWHHPHPGR